MNIEAFKNPPVFNKPAPFWSWNDKLNESELTRQIEEMSEKGWGGYFMHSRVGLVTEYLSDDWFKKINTCAQKARETGTYAWLYDEDKWPSGFAGGEVAKTEEYRHRALVLLTDDQFTQTDTVLTEHIEGGVKYSIAKRVSPTGNVLFNGTSYIDMMNPKAVQKFLECTHEKYKEHCGEYFGKEIPGIFTDEPCYLMFNEYDVPVLPWSECLSEFFLNEKHYRIEEHLVQLFFDIDDYQKIRYDFFDCASRLFLNSFTKQYYKWCSDNNLKLTGHMMAEDAITYSIQWIGSTMPHYEFMHWPGIDKLSRHTMQTVTVKQVTSVTEQLNKERALCEVFGCIGHQCGFAERKWIADWQAVLGISFVDHHLSLYSMKGERKRDYPSNLFYQQPWWDDERPFSEYISRLSYLASTGKRDVSVLVIHTLGSAWCMYNPITKRLNCFDYSEHFQRLTDALIENKIDFHFGDESIIENYAKAENGAIKINDYTYTHILVPAAATLKSSTVKMLNDIGENAIFITPTPDKIDGVKCDNIIPNNANIVSSISEAVEILPRNIKIIDQMSGNNAKKVICSVKTKGSDRIVLIANTEESREVYVKVYIPETRCPYVLDIPSGNIYTCSYEKDCGFIIINAKMYEKGSLALLFTDEKIDVKPCSYLSSGVSFNMKYSIVETVNNFSVILKDINVLPINDASLYLDGKCVTDDKPIALGWQHFYKASDSTPFEAHYKFQCKSVPDGTVYAVIEAAENLDSITINGDSVIPLRKKGDDIVFDRAVNFLDPSFVKVDITGKIKEGENKIAIAGKKINNVVAPGFHIGVKNHMDYDTTEFESIYIIGDFTVLNQDNTYFSISKEKPMPKMQDITLSGCPFYASRAVLSRRINIPNENCMIKLNNVNAANVVVKIDDTVISSLFMKPFLIDLTGYSGEHNLSIEIATTLFNLMGPNRFDKILDLRNVGPNTFVNIDKFTEKYASMPFGMESIDILLCN